MGDAVRGANEVVAGLEVEEVEILQVVVFGGFEDVDGNAEGFACFVNGVKEVEEDLCEMRLAI